MLVIAAFYRDNVPAADLTPTLTIYDVPGAQVVSAQMIHNGTGVYYYDFAGFDPSKDYFIAIDGGDTTLDARYLRGTTGYAGEAAEAFRTYDPPTKAELDAAQAALHGDIAAIGSPLQSDDSRLDRLDADISSRATPADVDVAVSLAVPAVQLSEALRPGVIPCRRADVLRVSLTGLGTLAGREKCWFTVKARDVQEDSDALIQIEETAGLIRVNGAAAETPANASVTVDDEAAGDITIYIHQAETAKLRPRNAVYDIKIRMNGDARTVAGGQFPISETVTRAI